MENWAPNANELDAVLKRAALSTNVAGKQTKVENAALVNYVANWLVTQGGTNTAAILRGAGPQSDLPENLANVIEKAGRYQKGNEWGGLCFAMYSGVTFIFSFALVALSRKVSRRTLHTACLLCGAAGLLSVSIIHDKYILFLSMTGVGIAWASILSMPYAMLSGALPPTRVGIYMGIFNFFIVLPEIAASLGFGWIMDHLLNGNRLAAVVAGGVFMLFAAIVTQWVQDSSDQTEVQS